MNKSILIADDNPDIRQTLQDIIRKHEFAVTTVKDGYEVLARLKEEPPDILILDLMMPEKGGIDIISSIKNIAPKTKIIIYTGFQRYENSIFARIADKFLLKDDNPEKLLQSINELL